MARPDTPLRALQDAIIEAGSQAALGKLLGVSRQAIFQALETGKPPLRWCKKIEAEYGISRKRLRPDIFA